MEYTFQAFFRYAYTGILHRYFNKTFPYSCFKFYIAVLRGELYSVPYNIAKNLQHPLLIDFNKRHGTNIIFNGDAFCFS